MQAYLFVHFREKQTPDGEQVYFSVSRDGYHWEPVHDGKPVLWASLGEQGVRDCTIVYCPEDRLYRIIATDLCLAHRFRQCGFHDWQQISHHGSRCLSVWQSPDLLHWSAQQLLGLSDGTLGCLWAPDVIRDSRTGEYVLHWSSTHRDRPHMAIYYSRTRDFQHFSPPQLLYEKEDAGIIDSAIYEEAGKYYLFVKCDHDPETILLLQSDSVTGSYHRVEAFDESMKALEPGLYEGPTAARLWDGRWGLFLDYYGVPGDGQGYVPLLAPSLESGGFTRADEAFSFPYGFKHGTICPISQTQYHALLHHSWPETP